MRFETPVPYKQMKGARKWLGYRASKESEVDRIERLAVALTDMDFLKLAGRIIRDPRIDTARLALSLSKGKYPYHAADIATEEIQAKLTAVDRPDRGQRQTQATHSQRTGPGTFNPRLSQQCPGPDPRQPAQAQQRRQAPAR